MLDSLPADAIAHISCSKATGNLWRVTDVWTVKESCATRVCKDLSVSSPARPAADTGSLGSTKAAGLIISNAKEMVFGPRGRSWG